MAAEVSNDAAETANHVGSGGGNGPPTGLSPTRRPGLTRLDPAIQGPLSDGGAIGAWMAGAEAARAVRDVAGKWQDLLTAATRNADEALFKRLRRRPRAGVLCAQRK